MDDKFYDVEEKFGAGCAVFMWLLIVFGIAVVLQMACSWLNSF